MNDVVKFIKNNKIGKIKENASLVAFTTYKVGGNAKVIVYPKDTEKLIMLLNYLYENNIKHKILGFGSNLIFSDKEYDGVLIKLDNFNKLEINGNVINVGAGYSLIKLSMEAYKHGLTGLEFAAGIPGTIGGACFMNAGAYKSDMGYIVKSIKVLTPELEIKTLYNKDLHYKYRTSFLKDNTNYICLEATIKLNYGDKKAIKELMDNRRQRRVNEQPLNYPSAGSVFRNPEGNYAGKLIEDSGLKGYKIGGAEVSEKHANFIINTGKAKASDVKDLINYVHDKVKENYDIDLKIEQEFVNWE